MYTITITAAAISVVINILLLITFFLPGERTLADKCFCNMILSNICLTTTLFFLYHHMAILKPAPVFMFIAFFSPCVFCFTLYQYILSIIDCRTHNFKVQTKILTYLFFLTSLVIAANSIHIAFIDKIIVLHHLRPINRIVFYSSLSVLLISMIAFIITNYLYIERKQFYFFITQLLLLFIGFLSLSKIQDNLLPPITTITLLAIYVFIQKDLIDAETNNINTIAAIYHTLFIFDFTTNTSIAKKSSNFEMSYLEKYKNLSLQERVNSIIREAICEAQMEAALEFLDFSILEKRMQNKRTLSIDLMDRKENWWRLSIIKYGNITDPLTKAIVTSQNIDDVKRKEQDLIRLSFVDELTGLYNRNAFITHTKDIKTVDDDFWYIIVDINGLKTANDTLGHRAGDELIIGVSHCLRNAIGPYGSIYRIGGDEFAATINARQDEFKTINLLIHSNMNNWRGKYQNNLHFSMGYVNGTESDTRSIDELIKIADKRMYDDKNDFYTQHPELNRRNV